MEEEKGKRELTDMQASMETTAAGNSHAAEGLRGPTWLGWVLSILVAVILSVTMTLLLGGYGSFRSDRAVAAGSAGSGCGSRAGSDCCPPADAGK